MANSVWISPFGLTFNGSSVVFSSPGLFPDGSTAAPGIAFSASPTTGLRRTAAGGIGFDFAGVDAAALFSSTLQLSTALTVGWASTSNIDGGQDTTLSRLSAGIVNVTTGFAAGSTAGVAAFGPSVVTSITVKGGIVTAIS